MREERFIDILEDYQRKVKDANIDLGQYTRWEHPTVQNDYPGKLAEFINEVALIQPHVYEDGELVEVLKWLNLQKLRVATAEGVFWPIVDEVAFAESSVKLLSNEMFEYLAIKKNGSNITDEGFMIISLQQLADYMITIEVFLTEHPKFIRNMALINDYDFNSAMLVISNRHTIEDHKEILSYVSSTYPDSMLSALLNKYDQILLSGDDEAHIAYPSYVRLEWVYHNLNPVAKEYQLTSGEVTLKINDETTDEAIRQLLGEPITYTTQDIEPKNILIVRQSTFDYGDVFIRLDFFQRAPEVGRIVEIRCQSSGYQTIRGIGIGSSKEEVLKAYPGAAWEGDYGHFIAEGSDGFEAISIELEENVVKEIVMDRSYP